MSVCAAKGIGIDELKSKLLGKTSILAGQSGVGKTTIINKLFNNAYKTSNVSVKTQRGKHTTTHVEFIRVDDQTYIADTPGFSLIDSILISEGRTEALYPEFVKYMGNCKFNGCTHVNEPSCAIKNAVESGEIPEERYTRYVSILQQIKESKRKQRGW
jgi:ribosome biogenesis GTPase